MVNPAQILNENKMRFQSILSLPEIKIVKGILWINLVQTNTIKNPKANGAINDKNVILTPKVAIDCCIISVVSTCEESTKLTNIKKIKLRGIGQYKSMLGFNFCMRSKYIKIGLLTKVVFKGKTTSSFFKNTFSIFTYYNFYTNDYNISQS